MADPATVVTRQGLLDRARNAGVPGDRALKDFAVGRLMARLEAHAPGQWLVKGGEALLTRRVTSRPTRDLDLRSANRDIGAALRDFEEAIGLPMADGVAFALARVPRRLTGAGTGGYPVYRIDLKATIGAQPLVDFHVDVVTGRELTGEPEAAIRTPLVAVPGMEPVSVLLFPTVDHIADKVCAIHQVHGGARNASTRVKDLHDLCTLRGVPGIEASQLSEAIAAESAIRRVEPPGKMAIPPTMRLSYERMARRTDPHPFVPREFAGALLAIGAFLDPVLGGGTVTGVWDPEHLRWS